MRFHLTSRCHDADELDPRQPFSLAVLVTQRIGVVPARASAVNGIRPDDFLPSTLAPIALLCEGCRLSLYSEQLRMAALINPIP